jgi:hypothetical protein
MVVNEDRENSATVAISIGIPRIYLSRVVDRCKLAYCSAAIAGGAQVSRQSDNRSGARKNRDHRTIQF